MIGIMTDQVRIWVLLGQRLGDNLQALRLAELLDVPFETKQLEWRAGAQVHGLPATFEALDRLVDVKTSGLEQKEWPLLIISAGRACGRVARALKLISNSHSKIVHIGNPRRHLRRFDLVVAAPQYRVPDRNNVFNLDIPLIAAPRWTNSEITEWRKRISDLPRPWIVTFIGGPSLQYHLTSQIISQFCAEINQVAQQTGGSLLITTSRRTQQDFINELQKLTTPSYLHLWSPKSDPNPYWAFIALADAVVVTGDSASMLVEGTLSSAPLYVFAPPHVNNLEFLIRAKFSRLMERLCKIEQKYLNNRLGRPFAYLQDLFNHWRIIRYDRNMDWLHQALYKRGLAAPFPHLPKSFIELKSNLPSGAMPHPSNIESLIQQIRALVPAVFLTAPASQLNESKQMVSVS